MSSSMLNGESSTPNGIESSLRKSSISSGRGQGRGRGNLQNQGQRDFSKNHEDNEQKGKEHEKCDLSHIKCYSCVEYEHFVSRCPQRNRDYEPNLTKTHELDVNHEEGTFFMVNHIQETIFMNEEKYTPPKRESNTDDEDDVWFGDGSCVSIKGKDLILFQGIEVLQGKDCLEIKQERYAMKILKEAGMDHCNPSLCPMEPGLKLSKAEDEPEVKATQLSNNGTTSFGIKYKRCNDMRLVGYSCHNVDIDDERSTTGHVFYLRTSPIRWCSQK
nr:hypothetical protein [Tanacetum cinerariifolium]